MNQQHATLLLQNAGRRYRDLTPFCAPDDEIAAYVDGKLERDEHQRVERHLADCSMCTDRVGLVIHLLRDADGSERPSGDALARARRFSRRTRTRAAPRWAAAAAVVLAIFVVSDRMPGIDESTSPDSQTTRRFLSDARTLQVGSPSPGDTIEADQFRFRWQSIDDNLHYELRIVTESGDLITEKRVQSTEWQLPDDIELSPGQIYFVRIDAFMPDGRTISSNHIRFSVLGRE